MQMASDTDPFLSTEEKVKTQNHIKAFDSILLYILLNVELKITVMRLQERLSAMEGQFVNLKQTFKDMSVGKLKIDTENEQRIDQYNTEIKENKEENERLQVRIVDLEDEIEKVMEKYDKEMDKIITHSKAEVHTLTGQLEDLSVKYDKVEQFEAVEKELRNELESQKNNLEQEKKNRRNEVNEKEREKIQATEKLRKDMLYKIKETKANLLALNDEQLQTTTRLTILQNHQLTTELEYQSKQTEQLLFKNNKMKAQIETLKRDIEIHKEVEKELAKRSHHCQKIIKKLKTQSREVEAEKQELLEKKGQAGIAKANDELHGDSKDDDMINMLESKLEDIERKLQSTQNEYETLQNDYMELQDKMNLSREKYKRAALLLTDFLDDILTSTPNVLQSDKELQLNLEKIKSTPIEDLDKQDKIALVLVLLKQLQPYLSASNLSVAPPKSHAPQQAQVAKQLMQKRNQHHATTSGGGHTGGDGEVEALNRILNNINVQTKKNEYDQKLPRKESQLIDQLYSYQEMMISQVSQINIDTLEQGRNEDCSQRACMLQSLIQLSKACLFGTTIKQTSMFNYYLCLYIFQIWPSRPYHNSLGPKGAKCVTI